MQGLRPLQRYFEFSGRSGRAEYWQWILLTAVAGMAIRASHGDGELHRRVLIGRLLDGVGIDIVAAAND